MADNLAQILDIGKLTDYKLHLAVVYKDEESEEQYQPLDVYIEDNAGPGEVGRDWTRWQEHHNEKKDKKKSPNRWSRQYILSFMRVYPEGKDIWLFGGIFEVSEWPNKQNNCYVVKRTEQGREYIGRLKIYYHNNAACVYRKLENIYSELKVHELLSEPYSGTLFIRYESTSLDFPQIASIINANQEKWREALVNHKGIDVIFR